MSCDWKIQVEPVWSNKAQNIATKTYKGSSLSITRMPPPLNTSRTNPMPAAGTCTKRLRPAQNTHVAKAIKTPGTPKAQCGPYHSSNQGVSNIDTKAPMLIEK